MPVPPDIYNYYLQDVDIDMEGVMWYTKYIVGKVGRFHPNTKEIIEYQLPNLTPGSYSGQIYPNKILTQDGNIAWLSTNRGGIAKLELRTSKLTLYGARFRDFSRYSLAIDSKKRIWGTGNVYSATQAGIIEFAVFRFDPGSSVLHEWAFPIPSLLSPYSIWIDHRGNPWFTFENSNIGSSWEFGNNFATINTTTNVLTAWMVGDGDTSQFRGIVGDNPKGKKFVQHIWMSGADSGTGGNKIYRYNTSSKTCEAFSDPSMYNPTDVILDQNEDAWFSSMDGHVNKIDKNTHGNPVQLGVTTIKVKHRILKLSSSKYNVKSYKYQSSPNITPVNSASLPQFERWSIPSSSAYGASPISMAYSAKKICFADVNDYSIGIIET